MKKDTKIQWGTVFVLVLFHVGAFAAPFFFNGRRLVEFFAVWFVCGCLGTCIWLHRGLTHGGFKTSRPVEYSLVIFAALLLQDPLRWVASHRRHHDHTDKDGDTHSPKDGFWWAHIGWVYAKNRLMHDDEFKHYAPKLMIDPFYSLMHRAFWVPPVIFAGLLFWYGGLGDVLAWMRAVVVCWHFIWSVNSFGHAKGRPRNKWWLAVLACGEGWHRNHHKWPWSARHGLRIYQIDVAWYVIWLMGFLRMVRNIQLPKI